MDYHDKIWPAKAKRGMVIGIFKRERSLNSGRTWEMLMNVRVLNNDEEIMTAIETGKYGGPSMSGFWGNCNEIRSGNIDVSLRRWDGKQWRKYMPNEVVV